MNAALDIIFNRKFLCDGTVRDVDCIYPRAAGLYHIDIFVVHGDVPFPTAGSNSCSIPVIGGCLRLHIVSPDTLD